MSQLKVNSIVDASGGSNAQLYGVASPPNSMGFRNRIINGDCRVDQRNAGASVTPTVSTTYTLDRWGFRFTQASKVSIQQNAGSVTPPAGFTNYFGVTSLSAYSVLSTDSFWIRQGVEGYNIADLGWGTANAQTVTLSFWVRSSLTGTFSGTFANNGNSRTYSFTYTVSAANTWEYKTITVAGDTSGTWLTTNGNGAFVGFNLGTGSSLSSTANSWVAGEYYGATGATSVVGTNGATFYITGVQLEAGTVASAFERRDYGRELIMCQRYYQLSGHSYGLAFGTGIMSMNFALPVTMRANPSAALINGTSVIVRMGGNAENVSSIGAYVLRPNFAGINLSGSGYTVGGSYAALETGYVGFSAEL